MLGNPKRILDPEIPLRGRLFQLLSTIALAEFIIVSVYTIVSGGDAGHIALMLCGTVLFAGTVAFTFKTGRMRLGATISGLLYFLMYPLTYFSSGGMYGGAPVVSAFAIVYVFLVTQKWERVVSLAVCIAGSGACYAISYLHPELLDRHTVMAEHIESFLSILLVVVLLCVLFAFVTEVYRTENEIVQEQKKRIEDMHLVQKRFFSSMSHEIRTPVNAIIGLNEMTLRADTSDEVRENAQSIEVASRMLLHSVNEIMDISKLESGSMEVVEGEYRTTAMLTDVVSIVLPQAQQKSLGFSVRIDPALPTALVGDEARIKQILLNVISNAVKYTKSGSVSLAVGASAADADAIVMRCEVADTGIGIREEDIPHLFTAYQRVDTLQTHGIEGTGLGLSIVKQMLDMMGGSVEVTSEYGKGSTFIIEVLQKVADAQPVGEVDLRRLQSESSAAGQSGQAAPVFSDAKVLVVDDTPMNLMVAKKLLRDTGACVDTAESGSEALEKTGQTRYDLILMDHQMPGMDGIECLHRIREQDGGKCQESRIVCLTANAGAQMGQMYREEGFDGYLAKPVRGKELEAELLVLGRDGVLHSGFDGREPEC